ncbi:MAG: hypothetical protein M1561_00350 [Gammaproteobacteria bacterium]|nr:hypothetical protein [Gammaproteobacteria bacterium]
MSYSSKNRQASLSDKILERSLPILSKSLQHDYAQIINEFKRIITAKEEPSGFYLSPTQYLKNKRLLTFDSVPLPNNDTISLIDDEQARSFVKRARSLYQSNNVLNLPELAFWSTHIFVHHRVVAGVKYVVLVHASSPAAVNGIGCDNITKEEAINFGPLISPSARNKLQHYLDALDEQEHSPQATLFFKP